MDARTGEDAKLYYGDSLKTSDSDASTITWNEIDLVGDATLNLSKTMADANTRGNNGMSGQVPTLKDVSIDAGVQLDHDDAGYEALRDSYLNDTQVSIACMDGDEATTGSEGMVANFYVSEFNRNENLTDVQSHDVTLVPSPESYWEWYEVA